jgi:iron complex outermembrane receptor protein
VEKVTSVPISITVADAGQLERQQVRTVEDLARIAPSLEMTAAAGQGTGGGGEIRGIGTQTFSQGAVASVGIVVDQVSQGNANISSLFDIARVEVLKGPQGTLFGLTTSAGVINITTNKPDMTKFSARCTRTSPTQGPQDQVSAIR